MVPDNHQKNATHQQTKNSHSKLIFEDRGNISDFWNLPPAKGDDKLGEGSYGLVVEENLENISGA